MHPYYHRAVPSVGSALTILAFAAQRKSPRPLRDLRPSAPTGAPDRKDDPEAVYESDQVTEQPEKGKQRHPEHGRPFRHRHHDGGADHERCRHDADGRPIDRTVEAMAETVEALEVEIDSHAAVPRVFDQPREVARH
jgi:hypothetical protein